MSASDAASIQRALLAALEHEPRVNLHAGTVAIDCDDGIAVLSGEVADIAAKRLTLELAAALPGVTGIVDRLHTRPAVAMGDGEIADHLVRNLLGESAFDDCGISAQARDERTVVRAPPTRPQPCSLEPRVSDGVVTLDGEVPSLSHKRLAGVLAWWVPASRDVYCQRNLRTKRLLGPTSSRNRPRPKTPETALVLALPPDVPSCRRMAAHARC